MNSSMQQFRKEYKRLCLSDSEAQPDPFTQFDLWFAEAVRADIAEPNAMTLATVGPDGMPSARMVLLKNVEKEGFVFFTNYDSRKGSHLAQNNRAALLFYWIPMERQVRVEGWVSRTNSAYSDLYFESRPRESKAGAIVSHQSTIIKSRESLENQFNKLLDPSNSELKRPGYWGGYILRPNLFEFWQGREHRLHDRIQYRLIDATWVKNRLAP